MLILRKVAVTGGVASGKTTVCSILKEAGAYVVNTDEIVHRLLSPETVVGKQVIHLLGTEIVSGKQIDRKKIANLVFSNPEKLHHLEALLHPSVRQEVEQHYAMAQKNPQFRLFVAEVPLLYEAHMEPFFDTILTVTADPDIAKKRYHGTHFEERMARKSSREQKGPQLHFTIMNNGDLATLKQATLQMTSQLLKENDSQ